MSLVNKRLGQDSYPGLLNEARTATTAGGGASLSTTAAIVGLLNGTSHVTIAPYNYATAKVVKVALNPYLLILKSAGALSVTAGVTDYSAAGQQNPATAGAISLSALAAAGQLYIGAHVPFRGVAVTMSASVNANASVMSGAYWNGKWTALASFTDGTASAGATFAQTGQVTWTVPTDWAKVQLPSTVNPVPTVPVAALAELLPYSEKPRYWMQLAISAALSANTAANTMFSLNRSTSYAEMLSGATLQFRVPNKGVDPDGVGAVELLTDAGTANCIVTCYTDNSLGVF